MCQLSIFIRAPVPLFFPLYISTGTRIETERVQTNIKMGQKEIKYQS